MNTGKVILLAIIFLSACQKAPVIEQINPVTPIIPHGIINNGSRSEPKIALTFDADMTPKMLANLKAGKVKSLYDQRITDLLEKNSAKATIFITGLWAQAYPETVKTFAKNPLYEIANHSWDHAAFHSPCYGLAETKDKENEITDSQKILTNLTGQTPKFFRFPGGCHSPEDVKFVEDHGLSVIDWDVISGDAYLHDPEKITNEVLKKTQNGSIIVMHLDGAPNSPATAAALPAIIEGLQKKGFTFVTLSELLKPSAI